MKKMSVKRTMIASADSKKGMKKGGGRNLGLPERGVIE